MKKVFITGATGFIGGVLTEKLLEKGYAVKVLIRSKEKLKPYSWKDKVEVIIGDILEPESFSGKINDCNVIIHSAAIISFWNKMWNKIFKINVIGTRNILEEALKVNPEKFIQISSVAAIGYGENNEPIDESHPYNWTQHNISYMETKHQAEEEVYKAIKNGLKATIVNPANVWGRGDHRKRRLIPIKIIKSGILFYVDCSTNFVDVDAVCEATINAIDLGKVGERYILGGENIKVKDFVKIIADELNVKGISIKIPKTIIVIFTYLQEFLSNVTNIAPRPTKSQLCLIGKKIIYDSNKARNELKMPFISIKECIHKNIDFYKENNLL